MPFIALASICTAMGRHKLQQSLQMNQLPIFPCMCHTQGVEKLAEQLPLCHLLRNVNTPRRMAAQISWMQIFYSSDRA